MRMRVYVRAILHACRHEIKVCVRAFEHVHTRTPTQMGIDQAISSVHARIVCEADAAPRRYVLVDGSEQRPSSNGTWFRLSPMHEQSKGFPLSDAAEILIGPSVRFKCCVESTVVEREVAAMPSTAGNGNEPTQGGAGGSDR